MPRRMTSVLAATALSAAVLVTGLPLAAPASAAPSGTTTVTTRSGLSLTVTPVRRLPSGGATVRVVGSGYDRTVGIYVALCVLPRRGQAPSPCGGGVNMSGNNPASAWISSTPPPYGAALAKPYRKGGRFAVTLSVSSMIGDIDCRETACAVVTRADHTRSGDRRFDVAVPVRFAR